MIKAYLEIRESQGACAINKVFQRNRPSTQIVESDCQNM